VVVSSDGSRVFTGGTDKLIRIWDLDSGEETSAPLTGHASSVTALHPDSRGDRLVSGGLDGQVIVWDLQTLKPLQVWNDHTGAVNSVRFDPEANQVVSAGEDSTVVLRSLREDAKPEKVMKHGSPLLAAAFRNGGRSVLAIDKAGFGLIWEMGSQAPSAKRRIARDLRAAHVGPSLSMAADANGVIHLVRTNDMTDAGRFEPRIGEIRSVDLSQDGGHLYAAGSILRSIECANSESSTSGVGHDGGVWGAVAYWRSGHVLSGADDGRLILWSLGTGNAVKQVGSWASSIRQVSKTKPDGSILLIGLFNQTAELIDLATGHIVATLQDESDSPPVMSAPLGRFFCAVAFTDSNHAVTGGKATKATVWDLSDVKATARIPLQGRMTAVASSPDGKRVAIAEYPRGVAIYEIARGSSAGVTAEVPPPVNSIAFSLDGTIAWIAANRQVIEWSPHSGTAAIRFRCDVVIHSLALSPDGTILAVGGADGAIRFIRTSDGQMESVLHGHLGPIREMFFSPTGRFIVSASGDTTLGIWHLGAPYADDAATAAASILAMDPPERSAAIRHLVTEGASGDIEGWSFRREVILALGEAAIDTLEPMLQTSQDGEVEQRSTMIKDAFRNLDSDYPEERRMGINTLLALGKGVGGQVQDRLRDQSLSPESRNSLGLIKEALDRRAFDVDSAAVIRACLALGDLISHTRAERVLKAAAEGRADRYVTQLASHFLASEWTGTLPAGERE